MLQSFDYDVSEAVQWFTDVPAPNLDTRVNHTALNTEFIGILDVDTLLNEEGMNNKINYCSILETPTKAPVSSSFTKSSSKDNKMTRRGILFSVENLVNAAGKGQTYSGHKQNDEARPNCLSFSKTPLNELLKMKENLLKENVAEATVPMS